MDKKSLFTGCHTTEEELIRQDEEFQRSQNKDPAAKIIRAGKRKNDQAEKEMASGPNNEESTLSNHDERHKSKFAQARQDGKKKKENLADYTVLQEAVSKGEVKTAVLGGIVARNVPSLSPLLASWTPLPSPHGFPEIKTLTVLDNHGMPVETPSVKQKKSLYMMQLEKDGIISSCRNLEPDKSKDIEVGDSDEKLAELGNHSFILDGQSGLGTAEEAECIHKENLSLLSKMSHEERLKERNEIMSALSPEQINFIQSVRATRTKKPLNDSDRPEISRVGTDSIKSEPMNGTPVLFHEKLDTAPPQENMTEARSSVADNMNTENSGDTKFNELPISPEEAKKWVHMDKVELEKLKWTTETPLPKPLKNNEGFIARFNFEGDLLPYNSDISWREGLHHHGEEPGRAGYSMDDLFIFVRSKVTQQRQLGLKTLANILRNSKEGLYDTCFEMSVIQIMVDAGLILLLRFAIDESTAVVYQEALRALYYLVCSEPDEKCIDLIDSWVPHGVQPEVSSETYSKEKDRKELEEEEKELKDVEVIQLDIIRALVRMDVHIRLRYFLESVTLSPPEVIYILGILKRIARHSLSAAWTIVSTPRLLSVITELSLPHSIAPMLTGSNTSKLTSVYGVPLRHAISFFKVLAARGRQIASVLINSYDLMGRILAYVSIESNQIAMPQAEVLALSVEAYSLWAVFLSYGLTKSQQSFSSFYPLLIRQLIFYRDKVDIDDKIEANQFNYDVGSQIGNVSTKALCIAATKLLLTTRMRKREPSVAVQDGREEVLQPPHLNWDEFPQICTLVENCLNKWMVQLTRYPDTSFAGLKMIGSFFNFLTNYFGKWRDQSDFEGVKAVMKVQQIFDLLLKRFLKSEVLSGFLGRLKTHSAVVSSLKAGYRRDPKNLGSAACLCLGGDVMPPLQKYSPFPLLLSLSSFLKTLLSIHPTLEETSISCLLNSKELQEYFRALCASKCSMKTNWIVRVEVFTIVNLLEVAAVKGCSDPYLYHKVALSMVPLVHKGDEHLIKTLLEKVVCCPDFIKDMADVETQIDAMTFKEYTPLKSPAIQQPCISSTELTQKAIQSIYSIGHDFVQNLLHSRALETSVAKHYCVPFLINTLTQEDSENSVVLDDYWCLTPLKVMTLVSEKKERESNQTSPERLLAVRKWLQMTYLLLKYRKFVLDINTCSMGWIRYLSTVFLASSDLFLDVHINSYVQACLACLLENGQFRLLNYSFTYPDMLRSLEWYKEMLGQYGSVSYGDSTFALFILIPLQRYWPKDYRILLFGEQSEILPFIHLTAEDVSQFIPVEQFLEPPEDCDEVIIKYKYAIANGLINKTKTPFLYRFAIHHISSYIK